MVEVDVGDWVRVGDSVIVGLLVMVAVFAGAAGGVVGLLLEPQEVIQVVTDTNKKAHKNKNIFFMS